MYEFRHIFPRNTSAVLVPLEGNEEALSFARLIESGAPVEVWADGEQIGQVAPATPETGSAMTPRRIIAIPG